MKTSEKTELGAFNTFLSRDDLQSTYRPMFLKSILYLRSYYDENSDIKWGKRWISEKDETLIVELDFISVPFTKIYWDMYYKFHLNQSNSPEKYFNRFTKKWKKRKDGKKDLSLPIKKFQTERPPTSFKKMTKSKYDPLRRKIIQDSFSEPLYALNDAGFYKKRNRPTSKIDPLIFDSSMIHFMKKYYVLLEYGINYKLTRYLEKHNEFSTQIAEKVLNEIPRRNLSSKEQKIYDQKYENSKCFYCKKRKNEDRDHVIPFNFNPRQELHNSIPSCSKCNGAKSDRLVNREFFKSIIDRNREFLSKGYLENYSEESYKKLYKHCKNTYHKGKKFPDKNGIDKELFI